jgi:hypothetical protein
VDCYYVLGFDYALDPSGGYLFSNYFLLLIISSILIGTSLVLCPGLLKLIVDAYKSLDMSLSDSSPIPELRKFEDYGLNNYYSFFFSSSIELIMLARYC